MNLDDFDYRLPPESIAQRPLDARDASRMLVLDLATSALDDRSFRDFPSLLRGDELIVVNNARVFPARLLGRRVDSRPAPADGHPRASAKYWQSEIEVFLVREIESQIWDALVRPGRKVRVGERIVFADGEIVANVIGRAELGLRRLCLECSTGDLRAAIERIGHVPLPPYIRREDESVDRERYQTVYASRGSAVAAPTAGLHFSPDILARLRASGVGISEITLDVGLGTFQPVRVSCLKDHLMHAESYEIPSSTAGAIIEARTVGRPILAVGTTVVRALEDSAAKSADGGGPLILPGPSEARIFLYPGKPFRVVDSLLTNFHLPRSSLLALVAAFAGRERILDAYRHAVDLGYRFYSYGDCMLLRGLPRANSSKTRQCAPSECKRAAHRL
jgi:S-adenosylmethionine:tRNA ribosyltransferase-isomerase